MPEYSEDTSTLAEHDAWNTFQSLPPVGSMKGLILHMAKNFDEPLEDFAEYMA